jgi:hypothetical protein
MPADLQLIHTVKGCRHADQLWAITMVVLYSSMDRGRENDVRRELNQARAVHTALFVCMLHSHSRHVYSITVYTPPSCKYIGFCTQAPFIPLLS